jgi:glyoxylase-like metal-dependent hydrolase (beta-lactamase superfamily II)
VTQNDNWQPVLADVEVFRDSCNVYAVRGPAGTIFVNAGTGAWLDALPERFRTPHILLCTHYFRDHSAAAAKASRLGMTVYVPEGEMEIFADPVQHFRERQSYIIYDNIWDTFAPIEPAVVRPAEDHAVIAAAGIEVTVLPLPGVTPHHTGYAMTVPGGGRRVVFAGEAIHSPGRMARLAPLQYDYNDLGGAVNAYHSADLLGRAKAEVLLPSLGEKIDRDVDGAIDALRHSLRRLCAGRPLEQMQMTAIDEDRLESVTDHVWYEPRSEACSWYLISDSGKALVIDYGYSGGLGVLAPPGTGKIWQWPSYPTPARRRALLHGIDALKQRFGIDRIDVALIGHYHDDHVAGVPLLRRLFGTACWAPESFADLLEHPGAHRFPCDWPRPITVDRRLPLGRDITWEEYSFRLAPMSGHTRFSVAILFAADGKRFAHTGDQYFFQRADGSSTHEDFTNAAVMQNHVYRNGTFLGSFRDSAAILRGWRPDIVISGHSRPFYTDQAFFALIDQWGETFDDVHRAAMVLGENETHFGLDSWGGWIWPWRIHVAPGEPVRVQVTVRNPLPESARLSVRLVGPEGWRGSSAEVAAGPRAEASVDLSILPAGLCRRQPIAAELAAGDRGFGQVAEALVTVGGPRF